MPQREAARNKTDRALLVEHDDALYGGWAETHPPKRERGLFERMASIERLMYAGVALAALVALHDIGVPTDQIIRILGKIIQGFSGS